MPAPPPRRYRLDVTTWTDRGDPAWLLLEPAYDITSRRNGVVVGVAHRRLTIRATCVAPPRRGRHRW